MFNEEKYLDNNNSNDLDVKYDLADIYFNTDSNGNRLGILQVSGECVEEWKYKNDTILLISFLKKYLKMRTKHPFNFE